LIGASGPEKRRGSVRKRKVEKRRKNKKNGGEMRRMKSKQLRIGMKNAKQEDRSTHT
jgi:hypothetical protein